MVGRMKEGKSPTVDGINPKASKAEELPSVCWSVCRWKAMDIFLLTFRILYSSPMNGMQRSIHDWRHPRRAFLTDALGNANSIHVSKVSLLIFISFQSISHDLVGFSLQTVYQVNPHPVSFTTNTSNIYFVCQSFTLSRISFHTVPNIQGSLLEAWSTCCWFFLGSIYNGPLLRCEGK